MRTWKKVLCPTDFSDGSREAIAAAVDLAKRLGGDITLLHVFQPVAYTMPEGIALATPQVMADLQLRVGETLERWRGETAAMGVEVTTATAMGAPFAEIVRYARDNAYDLIVLSTHGRSGLKHALLGSVAEKVVRKSDVPVLTIRLSGHKFEHP